MGGRCWRPIYGVLQWICLRIVGDVSVGSGIDFVVVGALLERGFEIMVRRGLTSLSCP